jgi:hypothetical protein
LNITRLNAFLWIGASFVISLLNTIFLFYINLSLALFVFLQYFLFSLIVMSQILIYRRDSFNPKNFNILFFLSLICSLFYFSSGFPIFSENPELDRIDVFERFGAFNRIIILLWQYTFVLALLYKKKLQLILIIAMLIFTGFRSFIIDSSIISIILYALIHRKLPIFGIFLSSFALIIIVYFLTYLRFGNLSEVSFLIDTIAYTQTNNIGALLEYSEAFPVNPFFMDIYSVLFGDYSYAQHYTSHVGNFSGQTAAVSLVGYLNNYSYPFIMLLIFSLIMLLQIKTIALFSWKLSIFMCWIFSRAALSHGTGLPIIIYFTLSLVLLALMILYLGFFKGQLKFETGSIL